MKAIVYYNWSLENQDSLFGTGISRKSPGYLEQEVERRLSLKGTHK